jgi:hydrogenase maturation factor
MKPRCADAVVRRLEKSGERVHVIGKITKGSGKVKIKGRKK